MTWPTFWPETHFLTWNPLFDLRLVFYLRPTFWPDPLFDLRPTFSWAPLFLNDPLFYLRPTVTCDPLLAESHLLKWPTFWPTVTWDPLFWLRPTFLPETHVLTRPTFWPETHFLTWEPSFDLRPTFDQRPTIWPATYLFTCDQLLFTCNLLFDLRPWLSAQRSTVLKLSFLPLLFDSTRICIFTPAMWSRYRSGRKSKPHFDRSHIIVFVMLLDAASRQYA